MRNILQYELLWINILVLMLIGIITFFPSNIGRIILGLPLLLFFPGYTLLAAIFPKRGALDSIERVALSFGLSIAVVPLIGLLLSSTPWGIRLYPVLISLTIFILITSITAWYRRKRLPRAERLIVSFNLSLPTWRRQGLVNNILFIMLIVTILGAIGTVGYVIATPKVEENFTEFLILGPEGKFENYPDEVVVGDEVRVMASITNHEQETVSYRLEIRIDGVNSNEVGPVVLKHDEKWEKAVNFTPAEVGDNQKVEFILYKNEESKPYFKPVLLWINVKEATGMGQ